MSTHPKVILAQHGLAPKKSLGQNFLFDDQLMQKIVRAADAQPADHVLEIGAGLGSLTQALAVSAEKVVAVELDNRFIPILRYQLAAYPHVQIVHGDILEQDSAEFFDQPYKVVANVPYYITGAILRHLLSGAHKPTVLVLTVQKEVAQRLCAHEGDLSLLAVSTRFYGTPTYVSKIGAGAFWPRPKIDSAIVRIDLHEQVPSVNDADFFRVVKAGFSQKRKQIKNNLKSLGLSKEEVVQGLISAEIEPTRRAQTLTMLEWTNLTQALKQISL